MAETKKVAPLTEGAIRALEALKGADGPTIMANLNAGLETPVSSAHLTALVRRGLVDAEEVEVIVESTRKVKAYTINEAGLDFKA